MLYYILSFIQDFSFCKCEFMEEVKCVYNIQTVDKKLRKQVVDGPCV